MKDKRTILLYCPPPRLDKPSTRAPLALLAISSLLEPSEFDIKVLPRDPKDHKAYFERYKDDVLCYGVSVMTGPQILTGLESSKVFKGACPDVPVVWGGWHPTILPEQVASHPLIDIAVIGQGEEVFVQLTRALRDSLSLKNVTGLAFEEEGEVVQTSRSSFKDVNRFPSLSYSILNMNEYLFSDELGDKTINYVSSRGCPYSCSFCAQNMVSGGKWYGLKAGRVVSDLKVLKEKYGIEGVLFDDANFFVDRERVERLADVLIEEGVDVNWGQATARIEDVRGYPFNLWESLKNSGLKSIFVGIEPQCGAIARESSNPYRGLSEDASSLAAVTYKYGIKLKLSILVGFPPEADKMMEFDEELEQAKSLLESCYNKGKTVEGTISPYLPFPHAPLFERAIRAGLKVPETLEGWGGWIPETQEVPWMPKGYLKVLEEVNDFFRWK